MKVEGDLLVIGRLHGKEEKDKGHNGKEVTCVYLYMIYVCVCVLDTHTCIYASKIVNSD